MGFLRYSRCLVVCILITFLFSLAPGINPVTAEPAQGKIINGPFLLAPTANGMTISWETQTPIGAKVWYGINGRLDHKLDVQCERGHAWRDNPEGICLYRAVLTGLTPDTLYDYKIELASGQTRAGSFKTLPENPATIRLYTISDSHAFKANKEIAASVLENRPDFIIHSGDIAAGSGYQKDKYESGWFTPGQAFLKNIPCVYINGNHDVGPYFGDYFMKAQRDTYNASPNGLNYSFNYGNIHIVMVSSNPWGLNEMNADLSNLPIDKKTTDTINDSLRWLEQDLKADAAKNAKWRIVVMHHPYTDTFTNKYAVNILENNNVNLVLAGHLHFYEKNISINPAVGAKTLYITQGTAEATAGEMNYGKPDERILSEFPEVVAIGKTIYGTLDITGDKLVYKTFGIPKGETTPRILDETVLVLEEPKLALSNVVIKPNKADKKSFSFAGTLKNEGKGLTEAAVKMFDNNKETVLNLFGIPGKERVVALNPGEVKQVSGTVTLQEPGKHIIRIGETSYTFKIPETTAAFQLNNLTIRTGQGQDANVVFATVEVTNPHNTKVEGKLDLYVNNQVVNSQKVRLEPYQKTIIDFTYRFAQAGTYHVKVENLAEKVIQIEGTLKGTPLVKDLSGHGNHGIIRGNPKLVPMNDDAVAVSLVESDGNYIEIPDSPSLRIKDGFSGIVWANLNRLSKEGEQERNPLMVKGPSLGWGANYLVRMLVKKSGGNVSWGTCYDTNEYLWEGGKAPIGAWTQYALTFNKATGGTSYINNQKAAEIAGISQDTEIRNWEGHPIFIGYAGSGHVLKALNRPKYYAHFPGQVSQVRFYSSKLSAEEVRYLNTHPAEVGPKSEDMLVWLNFKDIETEGTHKTEWRQPVRYKPAYQTDKQLWTFRTLTTDTKIPAGTSLVATVEVSDNPQAVKGTKEIVLTGGKQTFDLSDLPKAQYVRIVTKFSSVAGQDGTYVPELNQYNVTAVLGNVTTQLNWGTRADWEKGCFEGAIGFEPLNRTKVIEEYTDVIH